MMQHIADIIAVGSCVAIVVGIWLALGIAWALVVAGILGFIVVTLMAVAEVKSS